MHLQIFVLLLSKQGEGRELFSYLFFSQLPLAHRKPLSQSGMFLSGISCYLSEANGFSG